MKFYTNSKFEMFINILADTSFLYLILFFDMYLLEFNQIYCIFLLVQDWPLDVTDWSVENVLFMFGQMEDPSPLTENICDEVKRKYNEPKMFHLYSLLSRLHKERPHAPINPLYNEGVCFINHYLPQPDKPSQLYYFPEQWGKTWKESVTSMKKCEGDVKPCVIYMKHVKPTDLHQLLQACANMNQPVQRLCILVDGDEEIQREETSQMVLRFTDKAHVELWRCDFSWRSLHLVTRSLQQSTTLEELYLLQCRNIPFELVTAFASCPLRVLKLSGTTWTGAISEVCENPDVSFMHLEELNLGGTLAEEDVLGLRKFIHEDKMRILRELNLGWNDFSNTSDSPGKLLQSLALCPLRELHIYSTTLTGAISEVCKNPDESFRHLELLGLEHTRLTEEDVLALVKFIHEDKMPVLRELRLGHNDFSNTSDSLVKPLQSLASCPLRKLDLIKNTLTGAISEVCKNPDVSFRHLKILNLNYTRLAEEDVLALRKLIHEDKMPDLPTLSLLGNDFSNMSDSLGKLLETIDQKLDKCRVVVSE